MENSDSYSEVMGQANLFRNANFSALQQKANMYIDKEKEEKSEIEGVTMPLEIPLIDKFGGRVGKKVMEKLGMKAEEDDGLMKTLAKKGLNSLLEKAGLKKPDAKPTKPDGDDKDEPTEDEDISDNIQQDMDTSKISNDEDITNARKFLKNRSDNFANSDDREEIANEILQNKPHEVASNIEEQAENLESDQKIINKAENDDSIEKNDNEPEDVPEGLEKDADALGEEPELLSGVKSAVSDAKSAVSDGLDTGLSSVTSGLKSAFSDATTGIKDTVTTGIKDAVSSGGKSLAEKLAARAAEVEGEGGGPEDIGSDIVSAGLAIGAMFASIFGKHIKHPDIQTQESTLVATQGYGLAEQ